MSHHSDSESEASPEDPPFSISEDLIPSRVVKEPGVTALDFDGLLDPPLYLHEDLKEGCGGQLWPAGMVLAKFLLRKKEEWRGKTMFVCSWILFGFGTQILKAGTDWIGRIEEWNWELVEAWSGTIDLSLRIENQRS